MHSMKRYQSKRQHVGKLTKQGLADRDLVIGRKAHVMLSVIFLVYWEDAWPDIATCQISALGQTYAPTYWLQDGIYAGKG